MFVNSAKQKMVAGQPAFGYSLGLGSPLVAELLAHCGIDFLFLETQHGSWGHDGAITALMAMAGGSSVPFARVAKNDYFLIGKLLDQGVLGIVTPMVDTPDQAKAVADACRLPPRGKRSWGVGRARTYGDDYFDWIDEQLWVGVQIESSTAVDNAEAIMATPGIDGCWAGPADLALSMGIDPRRAGSDDRHGRALERILQACRDTGKAPGLACASPQEARRRADAGWQFLTAGSDAGFLLAGARDGLKTLGLG
jgi:4-hydroxy-2-oxoheptanedioate aldolase